MYFIFFILKELLNKMIVSSILGVQEVFKKSQEMSNNKDPSWLTMSNVLQDMLKAFKILKFEDKISGLKSIGIV